MFEYIVLFLLVGGYNSIFTFQKKRHLQEMCDEKRVSGRGEQEVPAGSAADVGADAGAATSTGENLIKAESGLCLWLHINGSGPLLCKYLSQLICTQYFADNFIACVMDISLNMRVDSLITEAT